ncbi:hypothetical protein BJX70DRAFT_396902 [Aspergillus crustosus]
MSTPTLPQHPSTSSPPPPKTTAPPPQTLPITTYHCRYCATLLIATTRDLSKLPARAHPAADDAKILPLRNYSVPAEVTAYYPEFDSKSEEEAKVESERKSRVDAEAEAESASQSVSQSQSQSQSQEIKNKAPIQKHYTILLSTLSREQKPAVTRRSDGFEKRFFARCGRCRVTMGYFLDEVHFPSSGGILSWQYEVDKGWRDEAKEKEREDRVIYLLPGALMETEIMDDEEKMRLIDREWAVWFKR